METIGSSRIAGIGAYLPEIRVASDDLMAEVNCRRFGIPEDYLSKHIGISERRVADSDMSPSDLATLASQSALRDAGVSPDEIDLIIFAGISRDCEEPSTAHFVQKKLSATKAVSMDISNACLGFMSGLSVADAYIHSGIATKVLVCTGETPSKMMDEAVAILGETSSKDQFRSSFGFLTAGDAGGAMVILPAECADVGLKWINFVTRADNADLCHYKRGAEGLVGEMQMAALSRAFIEINSKMIGTTYKKLGWTPDSVRKIYCHQVGKRPHMALAKIADVSIDRAPITYDKLGNLTSATIPVAMFLSPPERNDKLLFFGAGSGISLCQAGMVY
ncbi:MAG: ketoacyl-ACP synthase III [Cellvibrionaceae bacterium]